MYLSQDRDRKELQLISNSQFCKSSKEFKIDDVKKDLLKQDLEKKFYSGKVMASIFCIFDVLMFEPTKSAQSVFTKVETFGEESVNGVVLLADFDKFERMFIIKSPKDSLTNDMLHEYFVGVSCTNRMRNYIPNFAYILGAFKCKPPVLSGDNDDKKVLDWCQKGDRRTYVNYVIYEKVPGESLKARTKMLEFEEFFSYILQLAFSIHRAWQDCKFTHYDLHTSNVILRPWKTESFYIPYETEYGIMYVKSSKIATMIDFGNSRVEIGGDAFGVYGYESYGNFAHLSRPWYDIYKVLMFSLYDMLVSGNNDCFDQSLDLLRIIIDSEGKMSRDDIVKKVKDERRDYYTLSRMPLPIETNPQTNNLLYFLQQVEQKYPEMWKKVVTDNPGSAEFLSDPTYRPETGAYLI